MMLQERKHISLMIFPFYIFLCQSSWQTPTDERVSVASSLSEAEDKIIKPVCEQMKVRCGLYFGHI